MLFNHSLLLYINFLILAYFSTYFIDFPGSIAPSTASHHANKKNRRLLYRMAVASNAELVI